ncbi:hypothetical protein [Botrimarina sp.]|uniref:flagellin N-terminal helical domain-containing protein n=1 Tax=Botrimarina sp. TaxID=2795802 RepID=UPI0032EB7D44
MSRIQPLSTTRVTDGMTRSRLVNQVQAAQLDLFRLQDQISTGRRIFLPSEDPAAAQRASALQRTIERKEQSLTNLKGAVASLTTTESSLQGVAGSLNELKSQVLGVIDTVATDSERRGVADGINGLLYELARVGNATFASNYLLGGAERSAEAYARSETYVDFLGDERSPQTYVDLGQLFDTGVSGDDVLGGLSESIRGATDLNPQLTPDTPLARLRGGAGMPELGSFSLTYQPPSGSGPPETAVVDLRGAKTAGDLARLVEAHAPPGADLSVMIEGSSLRIGVASGALTIEEVGQGDTAERLGWLNPTLPAASITGADLDPAIDITTKLSDLGGAKTRGRVVSGGDNNDIVLAAASNGAAYNGVTVDFVDGASEGAESAVYDAITNTLTVTIDDGRSTAAQVADAINAEGTFVAEVDYRDQTSADQRGLGVVSAGTDLGVALTGGADGGVDLASGLIVTNGEVAATIDTSGAETVEDLLNLLNDPQLGLAAAINSAGSGLDVRSRRSGAAFTIGENGGTTAADLGIRSYTADSALDGFNRGLGVIEPQENDAQTRLQNRFQITVTDQGVATTYEVDPIGLATVQDVIDAVASTTGGAVTASLTTTGNGLVLTRADALDAPATASGVVPLGADTLTLTADAPGAQGNANFTLNLTDVGAGGLVAGVSGTMITVDLGGATPTSDTIAAAISAQLPGYTASSSGAAAVTSPAGITSFAVTGGHDQDAMTVSGEVAQRLGFFEGGQTEATTSGATVTSTDRNPQEVDSVFTTLIRLRDALLEDDSAAIEREVARLDNDIQRVTASRAEVGTRLRNLEAVEERLADEEVTLRKALSEELDTDLVEAISDFTQQQYALQASLQTSASLLSLTILDFI